MTLRRPVWVTLGCVLLVVTGAALLWLPLHTQHALDDWKTELRAEGVPARAVVYDRVSKRGGSSTTMYLRYETAGRTYEQEMGCFEVCLPTGDVVPIWVNPADPSDFVTDFDELNGHRGRIQGVIGAAGFVILVVAVPLALSRIPFRRWFRARGASRVFKCPAARPAIHRRGVPRRAGVQSSGGARFTSRSKHKRIDRG
ncbi:hypothetical protein GA0070607_2474 [Micromonospora coriariae]|uniref:DUF3592 domain-containing protein n=2 Tax=Micromonospora coriariae TaxID=285665 RepID=A0A1C4VQ45_9ACTN|nr:hypothetical protein GA0070607_2474 [Micromonospora coriariae]